MTPLAAVDKPANGSAIASSAPRSRRPALGQGRSARVSGTGYRAPMRAALFVEQHQDLSLEDVTALTPGPCDAVVRVHASGVCHSDQAMIDRMPTGNPVILGHEACGVVEWVGAEVSRVRPGQRVIVALTPVCGKCWFCLRQETHLCEMGPDVMARPRAAARRQLGGDRDERRRQLRGCHDGRRGVVHSGRHRPPCRSARARSGAGSPPDSVPRSTRPT